MQAGAHVVVFDLGNVLITWDRSLLYRSMFREPADLEHFLDNVYTLRENERLDRGEPLHQFCRSLAADHPHYESEILALADRWTETIGPPLDGTVAVLRSLVDRGVPCYALSNWNADTFALIEPELEFLSWFDGVVISGHEGVVKPDPEIFRRLFDRYGIAPTDALFIDDSPVNVEVARSLGMDAEVFTGAEPLTAALRARGLLP